MKRLYRLIALIYLLLVSVMALATVLGKIAGSGYASKYIYGAGWFTSLWVILACSSVVFILLRKVKSAYALTYHLSVLLILSGAFLTHVTGRQGLLHLRLNESTDTFMMRHHEYGYTPEELPFSITLTSFDVKTHEGTSAAYDYESQFLIRDEKGERTGSVSMNHIHSVHGYRLCQNAFDDDMRGSILSVNYDPYGIPVTYCGYALLFLASIWLLLDPKGQFRRTLLRTASKAALLSALLILPCTSISAKAPTATITGSSITAKSPTATTSGSSISAKSPTATTSGSTASVTSPTATITGTSASAKSPTTTTSGSTASAGSPANTLSKDEAARFSQLYINCEDRICPVGTFALDFTKTVTGSRSIDGCSAVQVLAGYALFPDKWSDAPVIRVKSKLIRERYGLNNYSAWSDFFDAEGYLFDEALDEYYHGDHDKLHTDIHKLDETLMLVMGVRNHTLLRIFPYGGNWYSGPDTLPESIPHAQRQFIRGALTGLSGHDAEAFSASGQEDMEGEWHCGSAGHATEAFSVSGQEDMAGERHCGSAGPDGGEDKWHCGSAGPATEAFSASGQEDMEGERHCGSAGLDGGEGGGQIMETIEEIRQFQHQYGGASLPSDLQSWSEHLYNRWPYTTILFMICLTMGFLSLLPYAVFRHWLWPAACFCLLSGVMALRWIITGTVPMASGYETMLLMAWIVLLVSLLLRRSHIIFHTFGLISAGFFLLVSHIAGLSPKIGHIMPVLQSPWLSIHVSIIMTAYTLLSLTALCGIAGLISKKHRRMLMRTSMLLHYPAMSCLGTGIFIGAIWANSSWGNYWSWDPKETWALITFMIYAIPMHSVFLSKLKNPRKYHTFMLFAFLTVIITYFGVNYILGGMHSYA